VSTVLFHGQKVKKKLALRNGEVFGHYRLYNLDLNRH